MPGGVAEQRDDDRKAEEERQRSRTSSTATINPHAAIGTGFRATARSDVTMASPAPAWRSSISGNDTTLMHSATTANRKPTPQPTTISHHPCGVVSTRVAKSGMPAAAS